MLCNLLQERLRCVPRRFGRFDCSVSERRQKHGHHQRTNDTDLHPDTCSSRHPLRCVVDIFETVSNVLFKKRCALWLVVRKGR